MNNKKIVIISGTTASGKTSYSINFAKKNNGVIINSDSMQIYEGLPKLSAQPSDEEKEGIEHLLFSYLQPYENCNVGLWLKLAKEKIDYCFNTGKTPIIVGGTGMYISKLINGISCIPEIPENIRNEVIQLYNEIGYDEFYKIALDIDEDYVKTLNQNDKQRLMRVVEIYKLTGKSIRHFQEQGNVNTFPKDIFFHININLPRDLLYERCLLRFKKMVSKENVVEEIKNFLKKYPDIINNYKNYSITNTIGLLEGVEYINNKITIDEFIEKSVKMTRNYAKRQYTWFNNQFSKFDMVINTVPNSETFVPIIS